MALTLRPMPGLRLLATAQARPLDLDPAGTLGAELDDAAVCARVGRSDAALDPLRRRQWVQGDADALALAELAARRALEAAGMRPRDLSAIVSATSTPHSISASMSARIGRALGCGDGLDHATACDVRAGGVGALQAWFAAQGLIAQGAGAVLVVAAEAASRFLRPRDLGSALVYADGAAACILGAGEAAPGGGFLGGASGQAALPGRPTTIAGALPPTGDLLDYRLQRPDREHLAALQSLWQRLPGELAARCPQAHAQLRHLLPYAVSHTQLENVRTAFGLQAGQVFDELDSHGCLGAAGPLSALHGLLQSGRAQPGEVVALAAAAGNGLWAGFYWRL